MSLRMLVPYRFVEPVTGSLGAGSGLFTGELAGEWTSRTMGYTGWYKAGAKAAVKTVIGLLAWMAALSRRIGYTNWSPFLKTFAFGNWGSILIDVFTAYYPGGIPGLAERWAITARLWTRGATVVSQTMRQYTPPTPAVPVAPTAGLGRY